MRAFVRVLLLCFFSSLLLRAADEARLLNIATRTQVGGAAGTPVLGFVVRGRVDGGTFEAHCGLAEGGGRWPPAVRTAEQQQRRPPEGHGSGQ